ncbi:MAG: hypothetical protein OXR62_10795 [Ahrensia sp.]|nr:hypothetical protein [Ahrensia sp.]
MCHEVLPEIRRSGSFGGKATPEGFGSDGTVPVSAYIELLHDKIALLEQTAKPKPKRAARPPMTDEEIATIRRLANDGLMQSEIVKKTGRSSAAISGVLRACPPAAEAS